ncbi:Leo1-like protein [Ceratocystis lukuohia]|uniref:Leo1-like protein n=2 Tax=Ceratocystis TaxID=5157 RepID=A0A0F8D9Z8_CERFI|nr:Leo1-like protein [Ceratocystis platani]
MSDLEEVDDLFGDEEANSPIAAANDDDDDELRSIKGDDDNDDANVFGDDDDDRMDHEEEHKDLKVMDMDIFRHHTPRSNDGRLQTFKVPKFLRFVPEQYDSRTFEPTRADIENARSENPKPTIRHCIDSKTGELRSNAMMYRWSDGSMSMSVGGEHYTVLKKPTAPDPSKPYDELKDGHSYAAAAHLTSSVFVIVGHMSEEYTVRQNKQHEDEALQRLAMRIREATNTHGNHIIKTTHDPEQQRRLAEQAEKERAKQQRRRDNAAARTAEGSSRSRGGGLGIDDLEGGRSSSGRSRKRTANASKPKRKSNANAYSDDDDDVGYGGGANTNDYDKEDDFIASSGEEEEAGSEDEEEILEDDDEEEEDRRRHKKKQKTAELDTDEEDMHQQSRRRRRVIDDDDDDEE